MRRPKTLADFPKFTVAVVRRGETSPTGYTRFEFEGNFDRTIEKIDPHWFWLLFGEKDSLCATLKSLEKETNAAIITCDERDEPRVVGQALAYLSPYWQAYNVWMVLDPNWRWEKRQFQAVDAIAVDSMSGDGREISGWRKLTPADAVGDQTSPPMPESRVIPLGWDHEHCDLCNAHIDPGDVGYCDLVERWLCEKCYIRYVLEHDLAFVDEL